MALHRLMTGDAAYPRGRLGRRDDTRPARATGLHP
jgi:hypothetical protein